MAELHEDFNANDVPEDDRGFDPLPAGEYLMQVIESDIKPTKSGSGDQLVLTMEVIEGPMANRRMWDRLNIRNQSPVAQGIAQRALADLCLAVGIASLRNSEDLHFKPFIGRVSIKQDKTGNYGPSNAVRYKPRGGAAPAGATARPAAAPSSSQTRPAPAAGAKPWQKAGAAA